MSDTSSASSATAPASQESASTGTTGTDGAQTETATFSPITSQEEFDRAVGQRVARERAKYADYADLKAKAAKLDELDQASKSEIQKAIERAEQAERELASEKAGSLRATVAAEKGVPIALLTGSTREELEASAAAALDWRGEQAAPAKKKTPPSQLKSGATAPDTSSGDAKERVAAAIREMRRQGA